MKNEREKVLLTSWLTVRLIIIIIIRKILLSAGPYKEEERERESLIVSFLFGFFAVGGLPLSLSLSTLLLRAAYTLSVMAKLKGRTQNKSLKLVSFFFHSLLY